jgi:uncharacterized protein with PIN domain
MDQQKAVEKRATFRFYEELNDFLSRSLRKVPFTYTFSGKPAVKDAIEAIGVPHTEVDLILVNGNSVDFYYHLKDGDMVSVYPVFESLDISGVTHLRSAPLRTPKFILDVHLGKLAGKLRMLGFDTLYRNDYTDSEVSRIAASQGRIVLTRDIGLLKIKEVKRGYWIRSQSTKGQLVEVLDHFDLHSMIQPFRRCMRCNGVIKSVDKEEVKEQLQHRTRKYYDEFYRCSSCGAVYWKGSHYERMVSTVEELSSISRNNTT